MSDEVSVRPVLVVVLAVALLVRVAALLQFADVDILRGDEVYYMRAARSIAEGHGHPGSLRPPLYPALAAAALFATGGSLLAVRLLQILLSLATVVCVFHVCRQRFDARAAVVSALACALSPALVHYSHFLWSEGLNAALVALLFVLLDRFDRRGGTRTIVGAGLVVGLAALTRETWLYFAPIVAAWIVLGPDTPARRGRGLAAAAFLVATATVIVPWTIRNHGVHGEPVLISTNRWFPIAVGNLYAPESWLFGTPTEQASGYLRLESGTDTGAAGSRRLQARRDAPKGATELERDAYWKQVALDAIGGEQPWWIAKKLVRTVAFLFYANTQELRFLAEGWVRPGRAGALVLVVTDVVGHAATVLAGLLALWLVTGDRLKPLAVLAIVQLLAVHVIANANPRFLVPVLPLLALYTGPLLTGWAAGPRVWWRWAGGLGSVAAVAALAWWPSRVFLSVLWARVEMLGS
jgi:4-amino-4-deoxy-L-arabinose transferase-like glycosyltransferase